MTVSVLIVEENGIIAFHICEILKRAGYGTVEPVASGEEALRRLLRFPLPGLVLFDAGTSGSSDVFCKLLRICLHYNLPVVILTTFSDHKEAGSAPGDSGAVFITMPFSERELLLLLEKSLPVFPVDRDQNPCDRPTRDDATGTGD